ETDSTGTVRVRWTMGRSAGEYSLAPHVDGVKKLLKLTAHAAPAAPANLSFEDAPAEKGARSQTKKLVAVVTDIYGNPVPDAAITLSVKAGMVSPARAITDARGRVAVRWLLGGTGEQTLRGVVRGSDVTGAYTTNTPATKPATKKRS
ncbi:MAG TPA: Ig-like domain-containing protein, partial [Gemmatimonadaceae bacterium]|nr:Ig-like domain-containing protein [Gemmatimonadaceae bacterium]